MYNPLVLAEAAGISPGLDVPVCRDGDESNAEVRRVVHATASVRVPVGAIGPHAYRVTIGVSVQSDVDCRSRGGKGEEGREVFHFEQVERLLKLERRGTAEAGR